MSFKDFGAVTDIDPGQAQEVEDKLRKYARDDAELEMFLEQCGLKPYTPGKPKKHRAEHGPVVNRPVRGQ